MKEGLASEHVGELGTDTLEQILNSSGIGDKGSVHLNTLRGDVADGRLDIVGDPRNEGLGVSVLNGQHSGVDILRGNISTENTRGCEILAFARIAIYHHVAWVEHLLSKLVYGQMAEALGARGDNGCETGHEEVKARERDKIDCHLANIGVELAREPETASDPGHNVSDKVVEIAILRIGNLQRTLADVVQRLIIQAANLVSVLDELVECKSGVVGLDDDIGRSAGRHHREGTHHAVGKLFADLGKQEGTETRARTASQTVSQLEALKTIGGFSFTADNVQHLVNYLSTFSVVALGEVVPYQMSNR